MNKENAAKKAMIDSYVQTFGKPPNAATKVVIELSIERVANGVPFVWIDQGGWKRLQFGLKRPSK